MKLSKAQQFVIDKMNEGYELGYSTTSLHSFTWLQKPGLGKGGDTIKVKFITVHGLWKKGIIQRKYGFPTDQYFLSKEYIK